MSVLVADICRILLFFANIRPYLERVLHVQLHDLGALQRIQDADLLLLSKRSTAEGRGDVAVAEDTTGINVDGDIIFGSDQTLQFHFPLLTR